MTSLFNLPVPDKATNPRQKSVDVNDLFLTRFMPPWSRPASLPANTWRAWVLNQPVAIDCRETLIASVLSLDWKITPINSNYREELDGTIKYYTKLFTNGGNYGGLSLDYSGLIEWIAADILDTPFGGVAEIGHKGGTPEGRVQWIRPLDAGTMYPTLNQDYPAIQYWQGWDAVVFEDHEISRTYMSPHTFIWREGWGMAPPEKVYFAMDLLGRGDKYYANLLLDIPTAGILDLGDMEKSSAEEWITAFKTFVNDNTTSFRVPVLYEHNNKVEFLPFGKVPNDIMFDRITLKYAALVCAAYGMSLSDIGLQTTSAGGETLAGSIRQERRTRKTGFARLKKKLTAFFNKILPPTLEFSFIDYDDELNVAIGKARLASATALSMMQDKGQISPQEARSQYIQDGLINIAIPDKIPDEAKPLPQPEPFGGGGEGFGKKTPKEPEINADRQPPSSGGEGEVKKSNVSYRFDFNELSSVISDVCIRLSPKIIDVMSGYSEDDWLIGKSLVEEDIFGRDSYGVFDTVSGIVENKSFVKFKLNQIEPLLKKVFGTKYTSQLKSKIDGDINDFIVRSIAHHLNDTIFTYSILEDLDIQSLIYQVHASVFKSLDEYLNVYIRTSMRETEELLTQKSIEVVKTEDTGLIAAFEKLQDEVRQLSVASKTPIQKFEPVINLPEINVNVPAYSERPATAGDDDMKIVINNPQTVMMESEQHHTAMKAMTENIASVQKALQETANTPPVVHVQVNPTPITVQASQPRQKAQ